MSTLKQIFSDPSVVAVVSLVGTWLLAHVTGVVKWLDRAIAVLDGGNISVQQVKAVANAVDPNEYARVVQELDNLKARGLAEAKQLESRVQAAVAEKLSELSNALTNESAKYLQPSTVAVTLPNGETASASVVPPAVPDVAAAEAEESPAVPS